MPRPSWSPTVLAAAIAAAMLWLAGDPLAPRAPEAGLIEPKGVVQGFPRRFVWSPVRGAEVYEVTVSPAGGEPLFRQRGTTTVLEISIDPGSEPPPGPYVWEVVAYGAPGVVARARASFVVTAAPSSP